MAAVNGAIQGVGAAVAGAGASSLLVKKSTNEATDDEKEGEEPEDEAMPRSSKL